MNESDLNILTDDVGLDILEGAGRCTNVDPQENVRCEQMMNKHRKKGRVLKHSCGSLQWTDSGVARVEKEISTVPKVPKD